jgi:hypothetical protein
VVGGAFSVIHPRLLAPSSGPLIDLHGQLMALIALPYLGPRAAGEELTRPAPQAPPCATRRIGGEGGRLLTGSTCGSPTARSAA